MARMSREFSLVLVGSGILTAGYFLWPEEELQAKQDERALQQVAGDNQNNNRRSHYHPGFIFIHTGFAGGYGGNSARPAAMGGSVSRGGFGSIGRGSAGG